MTGRSRRRFTNRALLIAVPAAAMSGLFANAIGTDWFVDPAAIHGIVALTVVVLAPWKMLIIQRGLRRPRPGRGLSVGLAALVVIALISGLAHSSGTIASVGPLTIMQIHIGSALLGLALLVPHLRTRPTGSPGPDSSRRAFMTSSLTVLSASALWLLWEGALGVAGARGARRRFTGSHERGSGDPAAMPVTSWLDDAVPHIGGDTWRLRVGGDAISREALLSLAHEDIDAVLDCTSGWFARQSWSGVRLSQLVPGDSRSVTVTSVTGYRRVYPRRDLDRIWLATAVGGEPLSAGHGYPARIVAPGRRGFWWVKWVDSVEATNRPWWLQLPFPAT